MAADTNFMKTALALAKKGIGKVEPNPVVGCVIVQNGKILGKGYHQKFGGAHAEINAFADCKKKGNSSSGATMYVTLEPCCHFGKTPPCTKAIIAAGIKKVVAATKDPTRKVAGKGFKILKKAGIKVITGICKDPAEKLNAPFFKSARTNKLWVIVKWAQSKDGFLSRSDGKRWLTIPASRKDVHKIRRRVQAILVGINTVLADDPMLTARPAGHYPLIRAVLDSNLKIPENSKLVKTANQTPVCIFTTVKKKRKLKAVEIVKVKKHKGRINLNTVLAELGKRGIQTLLVEGGREVVSAFLKQKLADELVIYTSDEKLGKKGKVASLRTMKNTYNRLKANYSSKKLFAKDIRLTGLIK
ncbi:MAG: bifunctional diaminohydroxyphosphoribosylaminopyrimidine deaminase/5-amino-6-(5-phosphoribosylamino)uracil reductase RibD [Phycisphaerae bacterium]|nr:bifunctional diaminohydroxyphosphoribosylaminopyrimidine deaminase/5-amino-6-(5-phosphoribosylamino)uracil reductase RibD [Phycisphaerae bacterium]